MNSFATIVNEGMGGFLEPPGHPSYNYSVKYKNGCFMSLEAAIKEASLDYNIRQRAKELLDNYQPPAIEFVEDWILQVLGYFHDCYRNPDAGAFQWHADNLIIDKRNPVENQSDHAGIRRIRKYYPNFVATESHFKNAYWGKKL